MDSLLRCARKLKLSSATATPHALPLHRSPTLASWGVVLASMSPRASARSAVPELDSVLFLLHEEEARHVR